MEKKIRMQHIRRRAEGGKRQKLTDTITRQARTEGPSIPTIGGMVICFVGGRGGGGGGYWNK